MSAATVPATLDLSGRGPLRATSAAVRHAAKAALDAGATHYTDRPGIAPLREAIAVHLAGQRGIAVRPETEVVVTCGLQEALFVALQVTLAGGGEALLPGPVPREDVELVRFAGGTPRVAEPTAELKTDPRAVAELAGPHSRALVLRSPNAAGCALGQSVLEELAAVVTEHDLALFAVEPLAELHLVDSTVPSMAALPGLAPRTITIGDFVADGLAGWRVGFLAGPEELVGPMRRLKQELSICSPAVSQHAALAAMRTGAAGRAAYREGLGLRATLLADALTQAGARGVVVPDAGAHLLVDGGGLRPDDPAILACGVRPGDGGEVGAPGFLRLSLDAEPAALSQAGALLGAVLASTQHEEAR